MKTLFTRLLALLVLTTSTWAAAEAGSCQVSVQTKVRYGYGYREGQLPKPLTMDVYTPTTCTGDLAGISAPYKPVLLVHGGAFMNGDSGQMAEIGVRLAEQGFVAFSINYRLFKGKDKQSRLTTLTKAQAEAAVDLMAPGLANDGGDGRATAYAMLVAMEDAIAARRFISERATKYQAGTRWGVLGASAGAFSVVGMAYTADDVGMGAQQVVSVVDLWGGTSPIKSIESNEGNLLIVHGNADTVVPYAMSDALLARANAVGLDVSRITMEGVGHGLEAADIFNREAVPGGPTIFEVITEFLRTTL